MRLPSTRHILRLRNKSLHASQLNQRTRFSIPALVLLTLGIFGYFSGFGTKRPDSSASIAPPTTPTVAVCGARKASDVELYTGTPIPDSPVSHEAVVLNTRADAFRLLPGSPDKWYIKNGTSMRIYNASTNALISSFTISAPTGWDFDVSPDGGIFVANGSNITKLSSTGAQVWTKTFSGGGQGNVYTYGSGSALKVATSVNNGTSLVWSAADGATQGTNPIPEGITHYIAGTNHLTWSSGKEVGIYDASSMSRIFYMGTDLEAQDPGPMHFYTGGGIEETGDGHYIVNDVNEGMLYFDANGGYLAHIKSDTYSFPKGSVDFQYVWGAKDIVRYNNKFYFMTGGTENAILSSVDQATITLLAQSPQTYPFGLGIGAGPYTDAPGNYFRAGTTPVVNLKFYKWWSSQANQFTGQYTIRTIQQVKNRQTVTPVNFTIPSNISGVSASVPVTLPSQNPGFYEMDVRIMKNGTTVGADCLRYSIGAPGQTLDLSTLPAGNSREVVLAAQFGQKLFRDVTNLEDFLPADPASTAPMDFSSVGPGVQAAAALAAANGVTYEMQLAEGGEREKAHVEAGRWQARVQEYVNYFKTKGVHAYEAWNEPNGGTYGNATEFTNKVLKPFYTAVKAADPTAIAVGGGILGTNPGYFDQMLNAGAINYMDVAGIHTYTGHNRSFEEEGSVDVLKYYQPMFAAKGKPNMEIWDTESGFWNSEVNAYPLQGDKLIRKHIHERSIGLTKLANFYNDGGFTVNGLPWALLNETELTPAGLASVVYKQYIADRPFIGWINTGVPHTYAAEFGALGSDAGHMVAVWSDDYTVGAKPTLSGGGAITQTDQYGLSSTLASGAVLQLTGAVTYLKVPAGQTISLTAAETYGTNYARNNQGASVSASSNASENGNSFGLASYAIDGIADTQAKGDNPDQISAWIQNKSDNNPWLQVTLSQPRSIDRIYVSSQGLGSVQQGLRNYDVQVDPGNGTFTTVAQVRDQYFARNNLVSFPAQTVSKIKLINLAANYSGYGDGLPPTWWPTAYRTDDGVYGQTPVYEIEAYAPGTGVTPTPTPTPTASSTPTPTPGGLRGDLNADGKVNVFDLSILLSRWGSSGTGDINNDGTVNVFDLSQLLSSWTG